MSAATTGAKMGTAYWRIAGMSYLKYANACGEVVRQSLKEPHLTQVRDDERTNGRMHARVTRIDRSIGRVRARDARTTTDGERRATQAKARETIYYKMTKYAEGKPGQAGA